MGKTVIDKTQVDIAVAAAVRALDKDFSWIRKSSLMERVYYAGIFACLSGIADKEHINPILKQALMKTLYPRCADDTFSSTQTGRGFESLRQNFITIESDKTIFLEALQDFSNLIERQNFDWNNRLKQTRELLAEFRRIATETEEQRGKELTEMHHLTEQLEHLARFIALLETDHQKWKVFDD